MSSVTPTKVPKMHESRKERKRRTYIKSNQCTHRTHTTKKHPEVSTNTPRSLANTTIAHSKFLMCIDAKFPPTQQSTPKFHNALKSKVSDYLKRPSKFPPTQQSTPKFRNVPKPKVSDYPKRPSKFLSTHEVWEFLTIHPLQRPRPTPTPHPRSLSGSLIASKIRYLPRKNFTP